MTPLQRDFVIGDCSWPRMSASADATRIAVTHSRLGEHHFDVFAGDVEGKRLTWRRLTRLNPIAEETIAVAPTERITYAGADGWEIEALYSPPPTPPENGQATAGAARAWRPVRPAGSIAGPADTWYSCSPAQAYAVLRPNPRGSMGYGVAFADAVLGDMGGKDFEDLLAGVD